MFFLTFEVWTHAPYFVVGKLIASQNSKVSLSHLFFVVAFFGFWKLANQNRKNTQIATIFKCTKLNPWSCMDHMFLGIKRLTIFSLYIRNRKKKISGDQYGIQLDTSLYPFFLKHSSFKNWNFLLKISFFRFVLIQIFRCFLKEKKSLDPTFKGEYLHANLLLLLFCQNSTIFELILISDISLQENITRKLSPIHFFLYFYWKLWK